jgi:hypothetical protein
VVEEGRGRRSSGRECGLDRRRREDQSECGRRDIGVEGGEGFFFFFFSRPREGRGGGGGGYELFEEEVEGLGECRRRCTEGVEGGADER